MGMSFPGGLARNAGGRATEKFREAEQEAADSAEARLLRHHPRVRSVPQIWHQDSAGNWNAEGATAQWEVYCEQCGDSDGPADRQFPPARELRGPYKTRHQARHAAARHERNT